MKTIIFSVLLLAAVASATTHFKETFGDDWESRWVTSNWKSDLGKWKHTAGPFFGDEQEDKGIQTSQDARFYAISSKFPKFSNEGKDLVVQFQVRFPQKIDCGGGYIKLLPSTTDQKNFGGDSPYHIMFGPDICGTSTKRIHAIFTYNNKNLLIKKTVNCETDELSHVYTLIVHSDDTYEIRVDGTKKESGSMYDDWEFLPAKTSKDPNAKKPADWEDRAKIDDPNDKKPDDHDKIPKEIPDPDAKKPEDWDDEADGSWEAPMIANPEWKGEWKPKQIPNPAYKGPWVHPEIPNPDYPSEVPHVYKYDDIGVVGIEVWQVKAGTIFDNIIVTDTVSEAEDFLKSTYTKKTRMPKRKHLTILTKRKRMRNKKNVIVLKKNVRNKMKPRMKRMMMMTMMTMKMTRNHPRNTTICNGTNEKQQNKNKY